MTLIAANTTQPSMKRRRPQRCVRAGAASVPAIPPKADAAIIQPMASVPMPRWLRIRVVRGSVLPSPSPNTATLDVTATKSRQTDLSSIARSWRHGRNCVGHSWTSACVNPPWRGANYRGQATGSALRTEYETYHWIVDGGLVAERMSDLRQQYFS